MSEDLKQRVVFRTMIGNIVLVVMKFAVGISAKSGALIAEAVHSAGDVVASLVVLVSIRLSAKPADDRHHFGHGKIESICSCLVGWLLAFIGFELCTDAIVRLSNSTIIIPGIAALYVAIVCIIVKELMYRYTIAVAKKTGSKLLQADAWHHRSDMMILSGVIIGIAGARFGYPILDGLVALSISVLIIRLGLGICWTALNDLVDTAPSDEMLDEIRTKVCGNSRVEKLHHLRARQHGSEINLEIHIGVDEELQVRQGHDVAEEVEYMLKESFPELNHILIHINPISKDFRQKPDKLNKSFDI